MEKNGQTAHLRIWKLYATGDMVHSMRAEPNILSSFLFWEIRFGRREMNACPNCNRISNSWDIQCECGYDLGDKRPASAYVTKSELDRLESEGEISRDYAAMVRSAIESGARFIEYQYCISFILYSSKKTSRVFVVPPEENRRALGFRYTLISILFGWWGIPFGPIWTIQSLQRYLPGLH